jgi:hypothetical protein
MKPWRAVNALGGVETQNEDIEPRRVCSQLSQIRITLMRNQITALK